MNLQKAVAMRVTNLLIENKLSKYAYLKRIAMNKSTLRNILEERYSEVKFSTLIRLADGFNMTVQEFLDDEIFDRENLDIE